MQHRLRSSRCLVSICHNQWDVSRNSSLVSQSLSSWSQQLISSFYMVCLCASVVCSWCVWCGHGVVMSMRNALTVSKAECVFAFVWALLCIWHMCSKFGDGIDDMMDRHYHQWHLLFCFLRITHPLAISCDFVRSRALCWYMIEIDANVIAHFGLFLTFSAFWLRASVVAVLNSLLDCTDAPPTPWNFPCRFFCAPARFLSQKLWGAREMSSVAVRLPHKSPSRPFGLDQV